MKGFRPIATCIRLQQNLAQEKAFLSNAAIATEIKYCSFYVNNVQVLKKQSSFFFLFSCESMGLKDFSVLLNHTLIQFK